MLTNSDRETRLEQTLIDVRGAAATVSSGQTDSRISQRARIDSKVQLSAEEVDFSLRDGQGYNEQVKKASKEYYKAH
jgi:hypothetical protein